MKDLRKIVFKVNVRDPRDKGRFLVVDGKIVTEEQEGFFHMFTSDANGDAYAIIEDVDGNIYTIETFQVRFVVNKK